jgi:hypothetical protein
MPKYLDFSNPFSLVLAVWCPRKQFEATMVFSRSHFVFLASTTKVE